MKKNNLFSAIQAGLLLIAFSLLGISNHVKAQTGANCATAVAFSNVADTVISSNQFWYKFTAPSSEILLRFTAYAGNYSSMQMLNVYDGVCSNLSQIRTASLVSAIYGQTALKLSSLTAGNTYYVELTRPVPCANCPQQVRFGLSVVPLPLLAWWGMQVNDTNQMGLGGCYDQDFINWDYQPTYCGIQATICANQPIVFTHASSNSGYPLGDTITGTYYAGWQFMGGSCNGNYIDTTRMTFTCTYSVPGIYNVLLGYYWLNPSTQTFVLCTGVSLQIEVKPPVSAQLLVTGQNGCLNDTLRLISSGNPDSQIQFYVDGIPYSNCMGSSGCDTVISFDNTPPYNYPPFSGGSHTVSLVVWDDCGRDSVTQFIHFGPKPLFTYTNDCRVRFDDASTCTADIVSYTWDFGDPASGIYNTASGQTVWHNFTVPGNAYLVTLTLTLSDASQTSFSQYVTAPQPPDASIGGYAVNNCGNGTVTYTAPCDSGTIYTWQLVGGTGTPSANGCSIDVSWSAGGGYLVLYATRFPLDCTGRDTLYVSGCCSTGIPYSPTNTTGKIYLNNTSASAVLADPLLAPFISGNSFTALPPNDVVINGVFTIDAPFAFVNCTAIHPGANAVIDVNPGHTLTLNNSHIATACGIMWDGIYVHGSSAAVQVLNGSLIQQSKNGIVSFNGGHFELDNAVMQNNVYDLQIKPHYQPHTGIVRGTLFTMNASFLPAFPALPGSTQRTLEAIRIESNAAVQIGDAAAQPNVFKRVNIGIHSLQSNLIVHNSQFRRIDFGTPHGPVSGFGILTEGSKTPVFSTVQTTAGGYAPGESCTFDSCRIALSARNETDLYFFNNQVAATSEIGVEVIYCPQRTISITNNTFTNQNTGYRFRHAVSMLDVPDATVTVAANNIQQSATSVSLQRGTGIYIANVLFAPTSVWVDRNTISRVQTGIFLSNIKGSTGALVTNNLVQFLKPLNYYDSVQLGGHGVHYGIRLSYCKEVRVDTNFVVRQGVFQIGNENFLRGVGLENSARSIVSDNVFTKLGAGVYGTDMCSNSSIACNTFNSCFNGCHFVGTATPNAVCDIGHQIQNPLNNTIDYTGNQFNSSLNYDVYAKVVSVTEWHDNNIPSHLTSGMAFFQTGSSVCGYFLLANSELVKRENQAGGLLNLIESDTLPAAQLDYLINDLYQLLLSNPSWLNLGTPADYQYQAFFDRCQNGTVSMYYQLQQTALAGDTLLVQMYLSAINTYTLPEENNKTALDIYSRSLLTERPFFSSSDSALLQSIALLNPVQGGEGVYSSRNLLRMDVDDLTPVMQGLRKSDTLKISTSEEVLPFPNPASESVSLIIPDRDIERVDYEVFDVMGRCLIKGQAVVANGRIDVVLTGLMNGVYRMSVYDTTYRATNFENNFVGTYQFSILNP
jgi:hypothetical protein